MDSILIDVDHETTAAVGASASGGLTDPEARSFAYVHDGQVYPTTLDGIASAYEDAHHCGDESWEQPYIVHAFALVPVTLHPRPRPYVNASDHIRGAFAVVDDPRSWRVPRRYIGTVHTTTDGRE